MEAVLSRSSHTAACKYNAVAAGIGFVNSSLPSSSSFIATSPALYPGHGHGLSLGLGISCPSKGSEFFVVRAGGKGKRRMVGAGVPQPQRMPSVPKLEEDGNPKFVIFVRDKRVPLWFPLNIITGGSLAKVIVAAMGNEWGKKMAQTTLTRDLGNALYKDEKTIRMSAIKTHPMLKNAKELEYGYKLVNMADQKSAFMPSNVTKIPPKEELKSVLDKVKDSFGESMSGFKDTFKDLGLGQEESSSPPDSK